MRHFIPSFALATVLALGTGTAAQAANPCRTETLPSNARHLVDSQFPGWRIKTLSDLAGYDHDLWMQTHPKDCPGIAVGHFEDPNQTAYGLLLVPKSAGETGYKLVVLAKSGTDDTYSLRILDHAEQAGADSGLVISKAPPSRYSDFDTTQSIRLKLDGIEAEWIEKASVLYFWRNGKYQTLQTSD
jgi:hypothetical protein